MGSVKRLQRSQSRCIPKPQYLSRRDHQYRGPQRQVFVVGVVRERRPRIELKRRQELWLRSILLPMQANPLEEWQRLSELYREKSEEELRELADDFADLTETAQQVLRDEMRKRGMGDPGTHPIAQNHADRPSAESNPPATVHWEPLNYQCDSEADQENTDQPHEYTWKTLLCECEEGEKAWQLAEVLRRAGIESWIERPGAHHTVAWDEVMAGNLQVLVAADQLDQARGIAAQAIPQEIVDQSKLKSPEFEPPACPQCGAKDPVLEGVDPVNSWRCEACGKQWTDSVDVLNQTPKAEPE